MAKAPSRIERVNNFRSLNAESERIIDGAQKLISDRNKEIEEIQQEILAELVAVGGSTTPSPKVGSISSRHDLREGDIIIAQGQTWAGSVLGTIVIFKELTGNNDIRAWTDCKRTNTDYGRGFKFLARPVE